MKVHLIDGTYELFRNYYGAPPKKGTGQPQSVRRWFAAQSVLLVTSPGVTHGRSLRPRCGILQ
jgi:hypothetical protein